MLATDDARDCLACALHEVRDAPACLVALAAEHGADVLAAYAVPIAGPMTWLPTPSTNAQRHLVDALLARIAVFEPVPLAAWRHGWR
ncbi:MAG: hypothetical protein AAF772_05215 [Acidobacteriota bacterium]